MCIMFFKPWSEMVLAVEHFRLTVGSAEEATLEVRRDCCSFSVNFQKKKCLLKW